MGEGKTGVGVAPLMRQRGVDALWACDARRERETQIFYF